MSFAFGFNDNDISDEESGGAEMKMSSNQSLNQNPLDELSKNLTTNTLPQIYTLSSILSTLTNVRISFETYVTARENIIYKRELFDVKHQVMCDDQIDQTTNRILIGEDNSDLEKNLYEGGFKSWECSYDSIDHLAFLSSQDQLKKYKTYLDLGCGTALPTCFIIAESMKSKSKEPRTYILSDFNYDVLRLVSLPNIILNWAATLHEEKLTSLMTFEDGPLLARNELVLTDELLKFFQSELDDHNITLNFVSGSWGREFNQLLSDKNIDFVISSETIYSNESLPCVAQTIIELLSSTSGTAIVAAKNIYFGVGGSVIEFLNFVRSNAPETFEVVQKEVEDSGLKRSIIMITSC